MAKCNQLTPLPFKELKSMAYIAVDFRRVINSGGLRERSPPMGSRGEAQIPKADSLQTLFTDFDCRNDQNVRISHNSPLDS